MEKGADSPKEANTQLARPESIPLSNLFRPGPGASPPHLAGRDSELRELDVFRTDLFHKRAPYGDVILTGPRGNGKTVLLDAFKNRLKATGRIETLDLAAEDIESKASLVAQITPKSWLRRFLPSSFRGGNIGWSGTHARFDSTEAADGMLIVECLAARTKRKPFVLLVDEAHMLDKDVGRALLGGFQRFRRENGAALLVLAGTPGLIRHLGSMGASFAERNKTIHVGLLSAEAASEALTVPFGTHGFNFDPAALSHVVRDSCRYPYFLQLWGESLTRVLDEDAEKIITMKHVEDAASSVDEVRNAFYGRRREELAGPGRLAEAALAVRALYPREVDGKIPPRSFEELRRVMPSGVDARQTINGLEDRGVVWQESDDCYVPGIQSLMDYLVEKLVPEAEARAAMEEPPGMVS